MNKNVKIILGCLVVLIVLGIGGIVLMVGRFMPVVERTIEGVILREGIIPQAETMPQEEVGPPILDVTGEDIPDVPRYPGSVRTSYTRMASGGERGLMISYITPASIDEVLRFYRQELPARGWLEELEMEFEGTFMLKKYKEGASIQLSVGSDELYPEYTLIAFWHITHRAYE